MNIDLPGMKSKKARLSLQSVTGVLVLAAILIVVNVLAQRIFFRWDWTSGSRYSLSDASKNLARNLQDPVVVKVYISENLPQPYETYGRYLRDILQEYRTYSHGKIQLKYFNPDASEALKKEAMSSGLGAARFTQVGNDQFQVREGYMGVVLYYQDKQEVLPFINSTDSLEYDISSRIKRMAGKQKEILGFVTGHGEYSADFIREGPLAVLSQRFNVRNVTLSTASAADVPAAVFIVGPSRPYSADELNILDGWIAKGAPVAFFVNRKAVSLGNFGAIPQENGLTPYLEHYGVSMDPNFVLDPQSQRISLQSNRGSFAVTNIVTYPAIPLANQLNKKHPLTRSLDVLGFPFVHPLSFTSTDTARGLTFTPLAESSQYSWIGPETGRIDPYSIVPPQPGDRRGPFALAAVVEGSAPAFSDPQKTISNLRMVVVGTSYFTNPEMPNPETNTAFLLTLGEWMVQDPNLLQIPLKGASFRPIKQLDPIVRQIAKILGTFFLPLLVVLLGVLHWQHRRVQRLQVENLYRKPLPEPFL